MWSGGCCALYKHRAGWGVAGGKVRAGGCSAQGGSAKHGDEDNFFKCHLLHCFISEKERGVFSNYREPHLAEIIQDAEKPEGEIDEQCSQKLWFLRKQSSQERPGDKSNHVEGYQQHLAGLCAGTRSTAVQSKITCLGCAGASHCLPGDGWHCLVWGGCVCEIILHHFHALAVPGHGAGLVPPFSALTRNRNTSASVCWAFFLKPFLPSPSSL